MRDVARGEVLVLTDARQTLGPDAVRALVEGLSDPQVACVSGTWC
jgi:cellulose synthase/poly-beta-1,6-N-acetylglucosamine synthase-like glycosyltransferase